MSRLFIAEKPSLGQAIAAGIGGGQTKDGYIVCGNGDVVTWAFGHLLENCAPADYSPDYKQWNFESLPITPAQWKLKVIEGKNKQLNTIGSLAKSASSVVNAGDPDREGSLLVDEIIRYLSIKLPAYRVLIADLNLPAVKKALGQIKPNTTTKTLSDSALARSRADWLVGMNLTRGFTLAAKESGAGVLSVGRVQTPVLGLVVRRDLEIENFIPHPFYGITASLLHGNDDFQAAWQPVGPESYFDDKGNLIEIEYAKAALNELSGGAPEVSSIEAKKEVSLQPLPFSLSELQKVCSKALGLTAKQTLEIAQTLYEKHKVTTYPRSDCGHLPSEHHANAPSIISAIKTMIPSLESTPVDASIKSHAFNDAKVGAHHGIIPTGTVAELSAAELSVFEIISRRYLANFMPEKITEKTKVTITFKGTRHVFSATGSVVIQQGWGVLAGPSSDKVLPVMCVGDGLKIKNLELKESQTTPPDYFTEATLLSAMTGIAKHLKDKSLASALKETDGLGTEATRAEIFETLVKRDFIVREKGKIKSTGTGKTFIAALPESVTYPDKTALWESDLNKIVEGSLTVDAFLNRVIEDVDGLVSIAKNTCIKIEGQTGETHNCPQCQKALVKRNKKSGGVFWGCTGYPECNFSCDDKKGSPDLNPVIHLCPGCNNRLYQRKAGGKVFWGCGGYPECKLTFENQRGKPVFKKTEPAPAPSIDKTCPECSKPMRVRKGPKSSFYGCSGYPECKHTEKM